MKKKLEELNKENFWDDISKLYPKAFGEFNKWIDEYKVDNSWDVLFNANYWTKPISEPAMTVSLVGSNYSHTKAPKFHNLPIAMQLGLLMQFFADTSGEMEDFIPSMKESIVDYFKEANKYI